MKRYSIIATDSEKRFLLYLDADSSSIRKAYEQNKRMFVGLPVTYVYLVTYRNRHLIARGYVHDGNLCAYGRVPRGADIVFDFPDDDENSLFVKEVSFVEEERKIEDTERCADCYYSSISGNFPDTSKYW